MARQPTTRTTPTDAPHRRVCAVMPHHYYLAETDPAYRDNRRAIELTTRTARIAARTTVIRIPVVVHVLHNSDAEDLGQEQIDSQIAALNRDYRMRNEDRDQIPAAFRALAVDTMIEFALAVRDPRGNTTTGVTRTRTSIAEFPYNEGDRDATRKLDEMIKFDGFGKSAWPRNSYLNLWTCNLGGGLLGYAQFPGGPAATDGVVIGNRFLGSTGIARAPFNLGRTGVHEVGHWLNLLHIWGDDNGDCTRSDAVDDTPNQSGPNFSSVRIGNFPRVSCNNGPNGDMFMNYMDYVDDDTMFMFTAGQLRRMNTTLSGPRSSLANSAGLTPVETPLVAGAQPLALTAAVARMPISDERGERPTEEFDGVTWV